MKTYLKKKKLLLKINLNRYKVYMRTRGRKGGKDWMI